MLAVCGVLLWDDDSVCQRARFNSACVGVAASAKAVFQLLHCILQALHHELILSGFLRSLLVSADLLKDLRVAG